MFVSPPFFEIRCESPGLCWASLPVSFRLAEAEPSKMSRGPLKNKAKPTTGFAVCSPGILQIGFASDHLKTPGSSLRTSIV